MELSLEVNRLIEENNMDDLKKYLNNNPEMINSLGIFGSCLHVAASEGHFEMVKFLVEEGADINLEGGD